MEKSGKSCLNFMYKGILTISSECTHVFVKRKNDVTIEWTGTDIGSVDHFANRVSSVSKSPIFYCTSGFYFMLEKYDPVGHRIEILKGLFQIPARPFNICTYKKKKFIMFLCEPDFEHELLVPQMKPNQFTNDMRVIGLFHWIIGVKGKFWALSENTNEVVFSKGPYKIDYYMTDLTKRAISKFLPDIKTKRFFGDFFNDPKKLESIFDFLTDNNHYDWYQNIIGRSSLLYNEYIPEITVKPEPVWNKEP